MLSKYLKCSVWRLTVRYDIYTLLGAKWLSYFFYWQSFCLKYNVILPCHPYLDLPSNFKPELHIVLFLFCVFISIVFFLMLSFIAGNVWETPHIDSKIVPRMRYGHSAVLFGVSNCVARVKANWKNCQKKNGNRLPTIVADWQHDKPYGVQNGDGENKTILRYINSGFNKIIQQSSWL